MKKPFQETITNEELNLLPTRAFTGEIVVVESPEQVAAACEYLSQQTFIGFDTETRPAFSKGNLYKVSLLQLSSCDRAFLFRLNKIALEKPILHLLGNDSVTKIGVAIRDDIRALQHLRHFTPKGFIDLQKIAVNYGVKELSLKKLAAITVGIRVSKAQRLSNWEAHTLTPAQQLYAATDAWVSREIYMQLIKR